MSQKPRFEASQLSRSNVSRLKTGGKRYLNGVWESLSIQPTPGLPVFFQKFLPGTKSLGQEDLLTLKLDEIFSDGVV